jgi:putative lipoprotein
MLDGIAEFFIFGLVPLVVGVLAVPELIHAGEKTIGGEVTYRERIALPPDAVLVVELADVSLADAPAIVIGRRRIAPAGQVPIRFDIGFDPKAIQKGRTYAHHGRRAAAVHHRYKPPGRSAGRQATEHRADNGTDLKFARLPRRLQAIKPEAAATQA